MTGQSEKNPWDGICNNLPPGPMFFNLAKPEQGEKVCPDCNGSRGAIDALDGQFNPCSSCDGSGEFPLCNEERNKVIQMASGTPASGGKESNPRAAAHSAETDTPRTDWPTGIEALVCADIAARQALGIRKYGQTVADNPAKLPEWLTHAYQEMLDGAIYLKRASAEIDKQAAEIARLREAVTSLGGYALSVRLDRELQQDGTDFCLQTKDWCEGLLEECERAEKALSATAPAGDLVSRKIAYRPVAEGEIIEETDEVLFDDCSNWEPIKRPGTRWPIGCAYVGSFFKPMRRPIRNGEEELVRAAGRAT